MVQASELIECECSYQDYIVIISDDFPKNIIAELLSSVVGTITTSDVGKQHSLSVCKVYTQLITLVYQQLWRILYIYCYFMHLDDIQEEGPCYSHHQLEDVIT